MRDKIKKWWEGDFIPFESKHNSDLIFLGGEQRRHWTSRLAHLVIDFLKVEWKWAIGTSLMLVGLIMSYIRFF